MRPPIPRRRPPQRLWPSPSSFFSMGAPGDEKETGQIETYRAAAAGAFVDVHITVGICLALLAVRVVVSRNA